MLCLFWFIFPKLSKAFWFYSVWFIVWNLKNREASGKSHYDSYQQSLTLCFLTLVFERFVAWTIERLILTFFMQLVTESRQNSCTEPKVKGKLPAQGQHWVRVWIPAHCLWKDKGTFSHSQHVDLWHGIPLSKHLPKASNNWRKWSKRNIYNHTHSKIWLSSCCRHTEGWEGAESTPCVFSGGTVGVQRKAWSQGDTQASIPNPNVSTALRTARLPTLSGCCWGSTLQMFLFSSLVSSIRLRRCYSHFLE